MSTEKKETAVAVADREVEFIPFGSKEGIKLSIAIVKRLVCVKTKNGHLCSDDEAIKFIMMCKAKAANPFEGDAYLIGYDGKDGPQFSMITAHQVFLKRAEASAEYDGMSSGVMVMRDGKLTELEGDFHFDGDTLIGGWATVFFKNRSHPTTKRIRLSRFNTGRSQWAQDPGGMICKCAEADALRSSFPTVLGGMYLKEEMDIEPVVEVKQPIFKGVPQPKLPEPEKPLAAVRRLCESSGLKEDQIVAMMKDIGLADEKTTTLDEQSDVDLVLVTNGWEDFAARLKGGVQ